MISVSREQHRAPEDVARVLRLAGGINFYGEANYRAVWGWSRLGWIGGKWEDRDEHGVLIRETVELRLCPKYIPLNRWHIERFIGREEYGSPADWYAMTMERENGISIPGLGPYPSRGEYELCFTLEERDGGFMQLNATTARAVAQTIQFSRGTGRKLQRAAVNKRVEKEELDYDNWADDLLTDGMPAFHGMPFVGVASNNAAPLAAGARGKALWDRNFDARALVAHAV